MSRARRATAATEQHSTSDHEYADLLARLYAIPAPAPQRRTWTRAQEREHLFDDLLAQNGDAPW